MLPGVVDSWLLYGANGYTGELIARRAVAAGERPVLAGRHPEAVGRLAAELGLDARVFALDDPAAVGRGLGGMKAVLHCAGPFSRTAAPMADGCLRARVHYLDITGEIEVFEGMAARHEAALRAGVTLLPGVGFDVVPSDGLAAHLHRRLPSATHLALGFQGSARLSRGTATTMAENLHRGGAVRRDGGRRASSTSGPGLYPPSRFPGATSRPHTTRPGSRTSRCTWRRHARCASC